MAFKFLIVDDDQVLTSYVKDFLEKEFPDCEVQTAMTNDEAFSVIENFIPDLITTDIVHPGGLGFELLTALRQDPRTKFIPVMASSGNNSDEKQLAQYRHGFDAVVPKPYKPEQLINSISRLLKL